MDVAAATCTPEADFVVRNAGQLLAAYQSAAPGDVIAIAGMVPVPNLPPLQVPHVTVTCASPGSGLKVNSAAPPPHYVMNIAAPHIVVRGLIVDGRGATGGALQGYNGGPQGTAELVIEDNLFYCGPGTCIFLPGVSGSVIRRNTLQAGSSNSGIHVQGAGVADPRLPIGTDHTRIEDNVITTTNPSSAPLFGAIRVRDGHGVYVARNMVRGPWLNAIAAAELGNSRFEHNDLADAVNFGVFAATSVQAFPSITGTSFIANKFGPTGQAAFRIASACGNVFVGNALTRGDAPGAIMFEDNTGDNAFVGSGGNNGIDNGVVDCDGDGRAERNRISGTGRIARGVTIGAVLNQSKSAGELN